MTELEKVAYEVINCPNCCKTCQSKLKAVLERDRKNKKSNKAFQEMLLERVRKSNDNLKEETRNTIKGS